jgi:hypothetical protein
MVSVLDFIAVDLVGSTQFTNKMCICCFFTKHALQKCCITRWDDICFILDQHTEFDVYCTNSLKQQSTGSYRNVASLKTLTWLRVIVSLFLNAACLVKKQQIHILLVNWVDPTRSTAIKSSTLTMTSQKQKFNYGKLRAFFLHSLHTCRYICSYKSNLPYDNDDTSLILWGRYSWSRIWTYVRIYYDGPFT